MSNEIDQQEDGVPTNAGWERLHDGKPGMIMSAIGDTLFVGPIWEIGILPNVTRHESMITTLHVIALSAIEAIEIAAYEYADMHHKECYVVSAKMIAQYAYGEVG